MTESTFARRYEGITGSAIRAIFSLLDDPEIISFAGGNPSPETFPAKALADIASELLAKQGDSILQYGGTVGVPALLREVRGLLEAEGLSPKMDELIILSGSSQGMELMAKALINPGDVILVESPSFLGALQTFRLYEARLIGVEMDEHGIVPQDLERKLKEYSPRFLYTIPTFQNPTGRTLPAQRRQAVAELCERYGALVLEDDPYAALRYAGEPQPSIKSFDKSGNVVKLMSFSKTISPGLRVGAAYGNKQIIHKFNLGKQGVDLHTANLTQWMVAEFIARGLYPAQVARNCRMYADKCALMCELARKYFPQGTRIVQPEGGMFVWIELPEGMDATALFREGVKRKVAYVPGTHFYAEGGHDHVLRLNFTMVDEARIERGMKTLGRLLTEANN